MRIKGLALLVSCVVATAIAEEAVTEAAAPAPSSAEQTAATVCAACHGPDGNSTITLNPKLAGQQSVYLYKQLSDFKSGKRNNAVMGGMAAMLSEDDMKAVADFYAKQTPKLGQAKSNGKGSLGEEIYRGGIAKVNVPACAACHGANGEGIPKRFPRLSGQHAEYTVQQLQIFRTGERDNAPMMKDIAAKMSEQEMQAVADYIQGLR